MFIHILLDVDGYKVMSISHVKKEEVLDVLSKTPEGAVSYVINSNSDLLAELSHYEYDDIEIFLNESENEGILVAKYDNDVFE